MCFCLVLTDEDEDRQGGRERERERERKMMGNIIKGVCRYICASEKGIDAVCALSISLSLLLSWSQTVAMRHFYTYMRE